MLWLFVAMVCLSDGMGWSGRDEEDEVGSGKGGERIWLWKEGCDIYVSLISPFRTVVRILRISRCEC